MKRAAALAMLGCWFATACGRPPELRLRDLDGVEHTPLQRAAGAVHVVVFTSHECPIANAYAPTLRDLAAAWRDQPVRLFVVYVDPDLTAAAAKAHATDYELPGTVLQDPHHALASALGATRTPEAVVVGDHGVAYRGRIDDQWSGLGARAQEPQVRDLQDAVAAVLAGRPAPNATTDVVGCRLPEPRH